MPRVTIPAIGSIGINLDQPAHELPDSALTSVTNIRLRDGCAARVAGDMAVFNTPPQTPYWIGLMSNTTDRLVAYAGLTAAYVDNGSTQTDITGTAPTGSADDRWTGGAFNGFWC